MSDTGGDVDVGRHHAVGTQYAGRQVGDVHGAALALAGAAGPAQKLAHHGCRVRALGQNVAMAAVVGEQDVVDLEVPANADGHRLLADRGVDGAVHFAVAVGLERRLLEGANAVHEAVEVEVALDVEIARSVSGWVQTFLPG